LADARMARRGRIVLDFMVAGGWAFLPECAILISCAREGVNGGR
jgi:hypothetical protein